MKHFMVSSPPLSFLSSVEFPHICLQSSTLKAAKHTGSPLSITKDRHEEQIQLQADIWTEFHQQELQAEDYISPKGLTTEQLRDGQW